MKNDQWSLSFIPHLNSDKCFYSGGSNIPAMLSRRAIKEYLSC